MKVKAVKAWAVIYKDKIKCNNGYLLIFINKRTANINCGFDYKVIPVTIRPQRGRRK